MNINPPELKNLIIDGNLMFDDSKSESVLKAKNIFIRFGSLIAGTNTTPYNNKILIELTSG